MTEYRTSGHAVGDIQYHLIWILKCRNKGLRGEVAEPAGEVIGPICQAGEVTIMRGAVSPDHIHMLVSALPRWLPAKRGSCGNGCDHACRKHSSHKK